MKNCISKAENIYIYGAGDYGKLCKEYIEKLGRNVSCFIISDDQRNNETEICGTRVIHLSEFEPDSGGMIIVAVNEKYHEQICENIKNKGFKCCFHFMTNKEYFSLFRFLVPVHAEKFMEGVTPVGDKMGLDRGTSISRYYITKWLDKTCTRLKDVSSSYEVGDDRYIKHYFPKANHFTLDYSKGEDLTKPETLTQSSVDVFICTQVFNFIYNIQCAVTGAYSVLKDDGLLVGTVAGVTSQISRFDMDRYGDYWRFSDIAIKKLLESVFGEGNVEVEAFGNAMASTAYIQGMCVEDLPHQELLDILDPDFPLVIGFKARRIKNA